MKRFVSAIWALMLCAAGHVLADNVVVPNQAPTTPGLGGLTTLLKTLPRSYQTVIGHQELSGLPIGSVITGITFRRPSYQLFESWPGGATTCSFDNYDISLSSSLNPPGSLSSTYTDNIGPDVVEVRSGPISFENIYFPGGAVTPAVNPFGLIIPFTSPYVYQGGDLLVTFHHTGNTCGFNGFLDSVPSQFTQSIGINSYDQVFNWYQQGLIVMKLVFNQPGATCAADIAPPGPPPGNGVVNVDDLLAVINSWGSIGGAADINNNGVVNVDDLLAVINSWGVCP